MRLFLTDFSKQKAIVGYANNSEADAFWGSKGQEDVIELFDAGSTYSCIRPLPTDRLGMIERLPEPIELASAKEGEKLIAEKSNHKPTRSLLATDGWS